MAFPPIPVYPDSYDTDRTLFKVYNTSEAQTTIDNSPWAQEIEIVPVAADKPEIWANNGYANISGELFYYDSVAKNDDDRIYKLKKCARNLGGKKTQFNPVGTWVRGFIIAEQHDQLVEAILKLEEFIGFNFTDSQPTLDWRIRNLQIEPICDDDHTCPEISFEFQVTEEGDNCTGIVVEYDLQINGFFKSFLIDFGDGTITTSAQSGTHTYPPTATIDPVVTVTNDKCQIVQTAIERDIPDEPPTITPEIDLEIVLPDPQLPTIITPEQPATPETTFTLPQITLPCELGFGGIGPINIPSIIVVDPPIPPFIEFGPVDFPSFIFFADIPSFSPIDFGPAPSFSPIDFGPAPSFSPIDFGPAPSFSPIDFGPAPSFSPIDFGPAPSFSPIDFGPVYIPSTISLIADIPSIISMDVSIPSLILVLDDIPNTIIVIDDIPSTIYVHDDIPSNIYVIDDIPSFISVIDDIPTEISVIDDIPTVISVIDDIPETITVEDSIPETITVTDSVPETITLVLDEGFPVSLDINWSPVPMVSIAWGTPPTLSCEVSVVCPGAPAVMALGAKSGEEFIDTSFDTPEIEAQDLGIPKEIKLVVPKIPEVKLIHELPTSIKLDIPEIPDIKLLGADRIPNEINIVHNLPSHFELVCDFEIPSVIQINGSEIPTIIKLEVSDNFPTSISVDWGIPPTIEVVGIPSSIEIIGSIPSKIQVEIPENARIPIYFEGTHIPVRFEPTTPSGEIEDMDEPCFTFRQCKR